MTRYLPAVLVLLASGAPQTRAQDLPLVEDVEFQPLSAATTRLIEALDFLGTPIRDTDREVLRAALASTERAGAVRQIQAVLDRYCLAAVDINAESRVKVAEGPAPKHLLQGGWRTFLVKVHNQAGVTARLRVRSPNAEPVFHPSTSTPEPAATVSEKDVEHRFLDIAMHDGPPLKERLSGLLLEYRIVQLYSRDRGKREATLSFDVGQGTQDIGFRNEVPILFDCAPAVVVTLDVRDSDGRPSTAAFEIRDRRGRIYPAPGRRLAPDFAFHPQVYRHSGESVLLPAGEYEVLVTRGPEHLPLRRHVVVPAVEEHEVSFELRRWIDTAEEGWISGDHHIHAAGCSHYESPSQGVRPEDMWRHMLGEDLRVGCVLSWGPCWYFQKQFFDGKAHPLSNASYVMRYDVEVSGFPSSHAGHLSLLRLAEDDYPGTERIEDWPSWDLPVLQWAKRQGGVAGFSHSGWGLAVPGTELPNYTVPAYDSIGANEYIVDVVHGAVDFISAVDTPAIWELNIWYHTLNCGFRTRISGETDFPCIYGERVGLGRSYVAMPDGALDFDVWAEGIENGRSYVSDGQSHLLDFAVGGVGVGSEGGSGISQLDLDESGSVTVTARVAALLDEEPDESIGKRPWDQKPYWHLERARIGLSRRVPVELVVNGEPVARREVTADGSIRDVRFDARIETSSWVAMRILPSSHTNPVFVILGGQPIRASRRSADWCLKSVDACWNSKVGAIRESERKAAQEAYEAARRVYRQILQECGRDE